MDKTLGKDYPEEKREAFLRDNCDRVELEKGYMKRLTPEEIQENKERLSEVAIKINDIELEKKDVMKGYKEQLEPLTMNRTEILKNLKQKAVYVTEACYKFIYPEEKMVAFYNAEGDMIEARPSTPDELQGNLFRISRTGTDDKF